MQFFSMTIMVFALLLGSGQLRAAPGDANNSTDLPRSRDIIPPQEAPIRNDPRRQFTPIRPAPSQPPSRSAEGQDGFVLKSIQIEGAKIYKTKDLIHLFRFYLNKKITIDTLNQILVRIDRYYQQQGWLAAKAILPQQSISGGKVRVRIFEGTITNIIIKGGSADNRDLVKRILSKLKTGQPARSQEVNAGLKQLESFSHFKVSPSLRPAPNVIGGVELVVDVSGEKNYSGLFSLSNTSSDSFDNWSASLSNSFYVGENTLTLYFANAFLNPETSFIGRASYEHKLDYSGSKLGFYLGGTRTRPEGEDGSRTLDSKSYNFGLSYTLPSYRGESFNFESNVNYDWARYLTIAQGGDISTEGDTNTISAGLAMDYRSPWFSFTNLSASVKQGLGEGGGPDNSNAQIEGGIREFTRRSTWLTANFSHIQPLRQQEGKIPNFALSFTGQGQYAFNPLVNSETIAFGRSSIGRGFANGRISGDHGWGLSSELRASWAHIGIFNERSVVQDLTIYSFFDIAQVFYSGSDGRRRGRDFQSRRELKSAGAGVRVRWADTFYIDFNWARAINNPFQLPIAATRQVIVPGPDGSVIFQNIDGTDHTDKGTNDFTVRLYYLF